MLASGLIDSAHAQTYLICVIVHPINYLIILLKKPSYFSMPLILQTTYALASYGPRIYQNKFVNIYRANPIVNWTGNSKAITEITNKYVQGKKKIAMFTLTKS